MAKIEINFEKKHLYVFGLFVLVLVGVGLIYAYNPSGIANPASMGHSANEIDFSGLQSGAIPVTAVQGVQRDITGSCPAGQYLYSVNNDGTLVCRSDNAGGVSYEIEPLSTNPSRSQKLITWNELEPYCGGVNGCEIRLSLYVWTSSSTTISALKTTTSTLHIDGNLENYYIGESLVGRNSDGTGRAVSQLTSGSVSCYLSDRDQGVTSSVDTGRFSNFSFYCTGTANDIWAGLRITD